MSAHAVTPPEGSVRIEPMRREIRPRPVRPIRRRMMLASVVLAAVSALVTPVPAQAAPGSLDPTFGSGGKVVTDLGGFDWVFDVAVQSDGKIVAVGITDEGGDVEFAVGRYESDGSVDPTFGSGGFVTTGFGGDSAEASGVAIQPDGKIVVVGRADLAATGNDFAIARYETDGSLDAGFGTGGKVTTDFGGSDKAEDAVLQPDGRIVVAGFSLLGPDGFSVARYEADGTLDGTFGTGGKVSTTDPDLVFGSAVGLEPDGKIVVAGTGWTGPGGPDFAVVRLTTGGALDPSFGTGGVVRTDFAGGNDQAYGVVVQPDGQIVAVGFANDPGSLFALARYNQSDGSLDASFGTGGKVTTDFGVPSAAFDVVHQPDGRLVATGFDFALARYEADGSLDPSFGSGGLVTTDFAGGSDSASSLALQADGKIVVGGRTEEEADDSSYDFALARYLVMPPEADLSITKTDSPDPVPAETTLTYTLTVANEGPDDATAVTVTDTLPAGVTFDSATPSQGTCNEAGGTVTCDLGALSNGSGATVEIDVTPHGSGPITNEASVAGEEEDPDPSNNADVEETLVFTFGGGTGGAFAIGDGNAALGTSATFWSARWSTKNSLSGGPAPAAFKGFARDPAMPECGLDWQSDPGNSVSPPAGPLPDYMGVIVTGSASQSGFEISGDTAHIVVVTPDPGYQPTPGHEGTGTVVAEYC